MALVDPAQRLVFAKQSDYRPDAQYPLGTNLALYTGKDSFVAEMESMGPVATLKPKQTLRHSETWLLAEAKSAPTAKSLRGLFD